MKILLIIYRIYKFLLPKFQFILFGEKALLKAVAHRGRTPIMVFLIIRSERE